MLSNVKKPKWARSGPAKAAKRINYYIKGGSLAYAPPAILRPKTRQLLTNYCELGIPDSILDRVNYYNKLGDNVAAGSVRTGKLPFDKSRYRLDLLEHLRAFGVDKLIEPLFGDITHIPSAPSFVKSRPIGNENQNSIVLKLDKFRHFIRYSDALKFEDKKPSAVWRGGATNVKRGQLCLTHQNHSVHDIGMVGKVPPGVTAKHPISPQHQLSHKYIISVEGNDVATNLKWIMSANSVCISPQMKYETWFMEGRLQPGVHYAQVKDDFSDLDDVIEWLNENPDEAKLIIENAQKHAAQFWDHEREKIISTLVIAKYLWLSGQLPDQHFVKIPFSKL